MSSKPRILIFIDWFLPGNKAGGPIRSVSNIINHLHKEYSFYVFTRDRDLNDDKPYDNVTINQWVNLDDKCQVFYASPSFLINKNIIQLLKTMEFDIIYFNSLFSYRFTIIPLIGLKLLNNKKKRILAPRGMFGKSSLNIKNTKKSIFLFFAKRIGLYKSIIWQTSTTTEETDVKRVLGQNQNIINTLNIPPSLSPKANGIKTKDTIKLFFLSRISPIKNLELVLDTLSHFKQEHIILDIFGPIEDELYWQQCQSSITKLNTNIKINYKGILAQNEIEQTLPNYHFLFLPTKHENFGYVIAEALSCGCPVIISNQTPWRELEDKQIGWDIDLTDKDKFIKTIKECITMNNAQYQKMSKLSKVYVSKMINESNILAPYKKLFTV